MPVLKENKAAMCSRENAKHDQNGLKQNCVSGAGDQLEATDKELSNGHLNDESAVTNNGDALSELDILPAENQMHFDSNLTVSSSPEDILSDVCSMLGTSSYALSRRSDHLLGGDDRMTNLRKQLSLVMTGTYNSVVNTSSTNPHNFKWPSSRPNGINALKSPTFSMADIAVVVPSNISGQEITNNHSYFNSEDADAESKESSTEDELVQSNKESADLILQSQLESDQFLPKTKKNKLHVPKQSSMEKKIKSRNSTSGKESFATNLPVTEKDELSHSSNTKLDSDELKDKRPQSDETDKAIDPSIALTSSQETTGNATSASIELAQDKPSKGSPAGAANIPAAYQQMACNAHTDMYSDQLHDLADGVIDGFALPECSDGSEWQYVGRNKPKRRQNQAQKNLASSYTRQVRQTGAPNVQRKKVFPERKWNQNRTSQPLKPRTLSSRPTVRPALTQHSAQTVKSHNPLRTCIADVNSSVKAHATKPMTEAEGVIAGPSSDSLPSKNDNVSSSSDTIAQPGLQQSLPEKNINHSMQQIQCSDTVLNGDNITCTMSNSSETVSNSTYPDTTPIELSKVDENGNVAGPTSTEQTSEKANMSTAADNVPAPISTLPKLEGEELIKQLKHQLEYYFSRENLAQDPYLVSQMDSQQYVSIWTIANFNAIKKLTSDVSLVVEALRDSTLVQVDETGERVRPNQSRCIVILREIPDGVKRSQIAALFDGASTKFSSCEFEGNGNWFVLFETENDAQAAYRHLRENIREFMGKPIMARIKSKTHHLNTYSCQSLSQSQDARKVNMEQQQLPTVTAAPQVPQQVASTPLEYLHPQQLLFCPQPHFPTSAHPASHVAAPPFIARVAAPNPATAPTSGHAQVSPVALNPPFSNFVVSPWQPTSIYSDPSAVMGSQFAAAPFLQPTFKPGQVAQHHYQNNPATNKSLNSSGHRNAYSQRKLSGGQHPQQQQQQQHGATAQTMPQSRYILSNDPNPPNIVSDMIGHYVQSDQAPTHVAQSIPSHHPTHYLPAVPAPFVTPNANEQGLVAIPQQQMGVVAHSSRNTPRRQTSQSLHHPSNRSQAHPIPHQSNNNTSSSGNRSRYSHSSRSSAHYQPDVGPRFFQKGMNQQPQASDSASGAYGYQTNASYTQKPSTSSASDVPLHGGHQDYRLSYSNKATGSYSLNEQHASTPRSPQSTVEKGYTSPDGQREHGARDDAFSNMTNDPNNNYAKRNNLTRVNSNNGQSPSVPNPAVPNGDQRNLQGGMDQRRNSRQRRRRNDDERSSFIPPPLMAPGNPSFNLESNSFPPLPRVPEPSTAINGQSSEVRPVAADLMKGPDTTKPSVQEATPAAPPPKKYSEVSSASHVTKNPLQQKPSSITTDPAKVVKKPENKPKTPSAVNTQPVADKYPPPVNKRPTHHTKPSPAEKEHGEPTKPSQASRANTAPATHTSTPPITKKSTRTAPAPVARKDSRKSASAPTLQKSEASSSKHEANVDAKVTSTDAKVKETTDAEPTHGDDDSADASDRKPTYAEMLKIKNAAAAAQMNGKAMSDSGKSDSGDDRKSGNDAPETNAKIPAETKTEPVVPQKRNDGNPEAAEKREGTMSGNSRRGDHEPFRRGSSQRYYSHRGRNEDFRGNRPRDWNGERGNGPREYRGRGGGNFRSRHGNYREQRDRFYHHSSGRPMPNGQVTTDR